MRKVLPIRIEFEYEELEDNGEIVQRMYNRVFEKAKQNLISKGKLKRREVENKPDYEKASSLCQ